MRLKNGIKQYNFFESVLLYSGHSKYFHHWALWVMLSLVADEFFGSKSCKEEKAFVS